MPTLRCLCGEIFSLSKYPNQQGLKLIWEPLIERFVDRLVNSHRNSSSINSFEFQVYYEFNVSKPGFTQMYECPNCGRLAVLPEVSGTKPVFWFRPEQVEEGDDSLRSVIEKQTSKDE